jgi:hypothetical protein
MRDGKKNDDQVPTDGKTSIGANSIVAIISALARTDRRPARGGTNSGV